jgi:hypothetical protein
VKTAKDYSGAKTVYFKPEIKLCPHCNAPLKRSHVAWQKHILTLKTIFDATSYAYRCSNKTCPQPQTIYRSMEAEMLSLKYYQFSLDVIAKVGHLRFQEHATIRQTRRTLKKRFKLQISRSEVNLLCQAYLALIQANRQQDTEFIEKLQSNGGVILSIDGLQPEKGNETLWILRDVQTGETLLAKNLSYADTESIAALLKKVKALGIPVKSVVSDGQRSIRLAVAKEVPGVPHQLCHFHFLRNIAKPVSDIDRALKVDLKKKVRGIRTAEKKLALLGNDEKAKVILQYCEAIHVALRDDGIYPLKPGGLRLWRCLRKIQQSIQKSNKLQPDSNLERLLKVLSIVDDLTPRYRRVRRLYKLIFEANAILGQEAKAEKVQSDMQTYVDGLMNLHFRRQEEEAAVLNILKFTASYWEGLFYHYDHKEIPRTNNDLEVYNRSLKAAHRKTTGRASCQGYIVRYGAYVALLDSSLCQRETLVGLRSVSYEAFRLCYGEIRSFRLRLSFKRSLSKDLEGFLLSQELSWAKTAV